MRMDGSVPCGCTVIFKIPYLQCYMMVNLRHLDWIHVFYPVRHQVSEQGSQRNKNVLSCSRTGFSTLLLFFILLKNVFIPLRTLLRNLLTNRIKLMNSVLEKMNILCPNWHFYDFPPLFCIFWQNKHSKIGSFGG